jgi:hypothetical protein
MKVYVASSYTNAALLDTMIGALRAVGHVAHDFRAGGRPPNLVFARDRMDSPSEYVEALASPTAREQFEFDRAALAAADSLVLVLPSGLDSHLEAGWAIGRGLPVIGFLHGSWKPSLMHKLIPVFVDNIPSLLVALARVVPRDVAATGDVTPPALRSRPLSQHANTEVSDHGRR